MVLLLYEQIDTTGLEKVEGLFQVHMMAMVMLHMIQHCEKQLDKTAHINSREKS